MGTAVCVGGVDTGVPVCVAVVVAGGAAVMVVGVFDGVGGDAVSPSPQPVSRIANTTATMIRVAMR
jgi:hypothetical protein